MRDQNREAWRRAFRSETKELSDLLGLPNLSSNQVSRTLNYEHPPHPPLVDALQDNDVAAAKIAQRLGLASLDFDNDAEVTEALASNIGLATVQELADISIDDYRLCRSEIEALEVLCEELTQRQFPLRHWRIGFDGGARFLASCLRANDGIRSAYRRCLLVVPSDLQSPFESELRAVAETLGVQPGEKALGRAIVDALCEQNVLLIFHGVEALEDRAAKNNATAFDNVLRRALQLRALKSKAPTPLLFIGNTTELRKANAFIIDERLTQCLEVPSEERFEVFHSQWLRFLNIRGLDPAGEIGSRLKRAQWHYDGIRPRKVLPINLRLRALFASNLDNYSFFDPTTGFAALSGEQRLPSDVQFFVEDVQRYLKLLAGKKKSRQTELRLLRLLSTAKYWLSPEALDVLKTPVSGAVREITGPGIDKVLGDDSPLAVPVAVERLSFNGETDEAADQKHYVMSIGVKAIIQDDWRGVLEDTGNRAALPDRRERSYAHYRVAKRLYDRRSSHDILSKEFPFDPHWGRHRIHLVSETLRHLIRACDVAVKNPRHPFKGKELDDDGFPAPPSNENGYCNPSVVLNFCFLELYRKELNGDFGPPFRRRELTKLHGAYVLAMELFQLMSEPGSFGKPHWALDPVHHRSFTLQAGYTALNVGQLTQASDCFRSLAAAAAAANDAINNADALLHLSLAQIAEFDLDAADATVREAQTLLVESESLPDEDPRVRSYGDRIKRRKAHLLFLRGENGPALVSFLEIFGTEGELPAIDKPELLIIFIELLEQPDARLHAMEHGYETLPDALGICAAVMFRAMSEGLQHEAMSFKIAFARLLRGRTLRNAAEKVLDGVHADIVNYGCSERTYLAFLLEAGETLIADDRPARAFITYLEGCVERAEARGFWREWKLAIDLSLKGLNKAKESATADPEKWESYLMGEIADERSYRAKDRPKRIGPFARDPLYGYAISDDEAENDIEKFKPEFIERKIRSLSGALEAFRSNVS